MVYVKGFSRSAVVVETPHGWLVMVEVTKKQGGWHRSRFVSRVYLTQENPVVYRLRPADCIFETRDYTGDYAGGSTGYKVPKQRTLEYFEECLINLGG